MYYSYSAADKSATIYLKVKAGAKVSRIEDMIQLPDKWALKLSINAAPEDGKANAAIIKMLAKAWSLRQDQLEIIKGGNQSIKLLAIRNVEKAKLDEIIC